MTDTLDELLALVGPHKSILLDQEQSAAAKVKTAFVREQVRLMLDVQKLGPGATKEAIEAAVTNALNTATEKAIVETRRGFRAGQAVGRTHANKELKKLGLEHNRLGLDPNPDYINNLVGDLTKGRDTTIQVLTDAIDGGMDPDQAIRREMSRRSRNAQSSASFAVNRGYSEQQGRMIDDAEEKSGQPLWRIWATNFVPGRTCGTCAALHGHVVTKGSEFPAHASFSSTAPKVYTDLLMPPRHPHCRCRLVAWKPGTPGKGPAEMRQEGRDFAAKEKGMTPKSWDQGELSSTAQTTEFLTSADVRAMSDSKFDGAINFFQQCLIGAKKIIRKIAS